MKFSIFANKRCGVCCLFTCMLLFLSWADSWNPEGFLKGNVWGIHPGFALYSEITLDEEFLPVSPSIPQDPVNFGWEEEDWFNVLPRTLAERYFMLYVRGKEDLRVYTLMSQQVPFFTPAFQGIPLATSSVPKVRQVVAATPTQTAKTSLSAVLAARVKSFLALPTMSPSPLTPSASQPDLVHHAFLSIWLLPIGLVISLVIILVLTTRLIYLKKGLTKDKTMTDIMIPTDYKILGELAAEHGRFQLAERCYRKVAELDPYDKNIHYKIGEFLVQTKRYAEAIKEFHIALGSEIILPEIYAYLTYAYLETKQLKQAEKYYHKVLELTPNSPKIHTSHGHTFNVFEVFNHLKFDHQ